MNDFDKMYENFHYPRAALEKKTAGTFYITFEVDTLGHAGNYIVIDDIGNGCADTMVTILQALPNYWLVAKKDGKSYVSKFIIPVTFSMLEDGLEIISEKEKSLLIPPVAKELRKILIRIMGFSRFEKRNGW